MSTRPQIVRKDSRIEVMRRPEIPGLHELGVGVEYYEGYRQERPTVHTHDIVEMVYVCGGHGQHILGDHEEPADPGSLAIIHYNQAHGFRTGERGLDLINLYLDLQRYALPSLPEVLKDILPRIIPLHPRLGHRRRNLIHIQFDDPRPIRFLLFSMLHEIAERPPGYAEQVQHYMALFLTACCRRHVAQQREQRRRGAGDTRRRHHSRLERLRQHMDAHATETMSLEELARLAGVQKNYLCRLFKHYTGQTVFHYLRQRRLEKALVLLRQSDWKIIEIAQACGFAGLPYFNRVFKREIGLSPGVYRRRCRHT